MTRQQKLDWDVIEREYIYDAAKSPVSYSQLALRHNVARNTVAERGTREQWYEKREEFRRQLGIKATEALSEEWQKFDVAVRKKVTALSLKYLDAYEKALDAGEIKPNTRDMVAVTAMLTALAQNAAASAINETGEVKIIDPDSHVLDPDTARQALAAIESMERRRLGDGEPGADQDAPEERAS